MPWPGEGPAASTPVTGDVTGGGTGLTTWGQPVHNIGLITVWVLPETRLAPCDVIGVTVYLPVNDRWNLAVNR